MDISLFNHQGALNQHFFTLISEADKTAILASIAQHYGTDTDTILANVIDADAYHLLEYMVEPMRTKTMHKMMQHNLFSVHG